MPFHGEYLFKNLRVTVALIIYGFILHVLQDIPNNFGIQSFTKDLPNNCCQEQSSEPDNRLTSGK
jgi:hypothetical protein